MENVANLMDIMLAFACGLMIAIVTFANIDLNTLQARERILISWEPRTRILRPENSL